MKGFKQSKSCKSKVLLFSALFSVLIASLVGLLFLNTSKSQAEVILGETGVNSEYSVGEIIELSPATLSVDGQELSVKPIVYFPNGSAKTAEEIVLTQTGKYLLEYGATVSGKYYSEVKEFKVYDYVVSNSGTDQPLSYVDGEFEVLHYDQGLYIDQDGVVLVYKSEYELIKALTNAQNKLISLMKQNKANDSDDMLSAINALKDAMYNYSLEGGQFYDKSDEQNPSLLADQTAVVKVDKLLRKIEVQPDGDKNSIVKLVENVEYYFDGENQIIEKSVYDDVKARQANIFNAHKALLSFMYEKNYDEQTQKFYANNVEVTDETEQAELRNKLNLGYANAQRLLGFNGGKFYIYGVEVTDAALIKDLTEQLADKKKSVDKQLGYNASDDKFYKDSVEITDEQELEKLVSELNQKQKAFSDAKAKLVLAGELSYYDQNGVYIRSKESKEHIESEYLSRKNAKELAEAEINLIKQTSLKKALGIEENDDEFFKKITDETEIARLRKELEISTKELVWQNGYKGEKDFYTVIEVTDSTELSTLKTNLENQVATVYSNFGYNSTDKKFYKDSVVVTDNAEISKLQSGMNLALREIYADAYYVKADEKFFKFGEKITKQIELMELAKIMTNGLKEITVKLLYDFNDDAFYTQLNKEESANFTDQLKEARKVRDTANSRLVDISEYSNRTVQLSGLQFSLKSGETIKYNKILDLSNSTLDQAIISIEGLPQVHGKSEAEDVFVRLTDVYDSENYITIRARREPSDTDYYTVDKLTGQSIHHEGVVKDYCYVVASYGMQYHVGGSYVDHANYGLGVENGYVGRWGSKHSSLSFYFDYAQKKIYAGDKKELVIDLRSAYEVAWQGFTTGECYLTVWADRYDSVDVNATFNGIITSIYGQDLGADVGEDGKVPLLKITQVQAPEVDFREYEEQSNIPNAMVGQPYAIFDSSIYSVYVDSPINVKVYYGYYTSSKSSVVISNGKFIPTRDGIYTIVYTVTDIFGNTNQTLVDVYAEKKGDLTFTFSVPFSSEHSSGTVGAAIELPMPDLTTLEGNFGSVNFTITAKHQNGTTIEIKDGKFIPLEEGTWTIEYLAIDAVERSAKLTYEVIVSISDKVVFGEISNLNKFFIVGAKNPIPNITVIDYTAGATVKNADKIYVMYNGQKIADVTEGYFIPESAGDYTLVYEGISSRAVSNFKTFTIKAVNVGFASELSVDKYFYSEGYVSSGVKSNVTDQYKGVIYTAKGNTPIEFIRAVDGVSFDFTFNIDQASLSLVKSVVLTLTDINNSNESIQIKIARNVKNSTISINGEKERNLESYTLGGTADFVLKISSGQVNIGKNSVGINNYLNGQSYQGFSSSLVNLSIMAETNLDTDQVCFKFSEICGQRLNVVKDGSNPRLIIPEPPKTRYLPGETIKIAGIKVSDVIDPYTTSSLTVTDKDNNVLKDVNGLTLKDVDVTKDYFILASNLGQYKIIYQYKDSNGNGTNEGGRTSIVNIISREKPVISLNVAQKTAKLGSTQKVEKATVTGVSSKIETYIFIQAPEGKLKELSRDEKSKEYIYDITLDQVGEYLVRYMAIDEWGNMSIADYVIKVS